MSGNIYNEIQNECKIRSKWQQLNEVVYFLGTIEKNDIVNFYHTIPAQETKKTKQFTNINRFI